MRHVVRSLGFTVVPAAIGIALYLHDRPYVAAIFFVAAGLGLAADLMIVRKAWRARGADTQE